MVGIEGKKWKGTRPYTSSKVAHTLPGYKVILALRILVQSGPSFGVNVETANNPKIFAEFGLTKR